MKIEIEAEEVFQFSTFSQWVNNATYKFKALGKHHATVCIDAGGNVCHIGEDFQLAKTKGLFPVKVYSLQRTKDAKIKTTNNNG